MCVCVCVVQCAKYSVCVVQRAMYNVRSSVRGTVCVWCRLNSVCSSVRLRVQYSTVQYAQCCPTHSHRGYTPLPVIAQKRGYR